MQRVYSLTGYSITLSAVMSANNSCAARNAALALSHIRPDSLTVCSAENMVSNESRPVPGTILPVITMVHCCCI